MKVDEIPQEVFASLNKGVVIPALPLALNKNRKLDERRQRALFRYYLDAGSGGIAVGVHTTQFAIRQPGIDLLKPILEIAKEEFDSFSLSTKKPIIRIAGVIGRTEQAVKEAMLAGQMVFMPCCSAWPHSKMIQITPLLNIAVW